ncbi:MAG: hypothetical protein KAT17_04725 [Candidatus Aminicenantes bacterium]|nr:hypothetical protein [Candidatus Aminicenantes bacterium]
MSDKSKALSGQWIATYRTEDQSFRQVLDCLLNIQKWLFINQCKPKKIQVTIDKRKPKNHFFRQNKTMYIFINRCDQLDMVEQDSPQIIKMKLRIFPTQIKKIMLAVPSIPTDKRWQSLSLPASSLFLGSSLLNNNFQVQVEKLNLLLPQFRKDRFNYDLLGLTLYEDLFQVISEWIKPLRQHFSGLIAAGGPMVTLNPLESAFHLPQFNLWVRGESEFIFPRLLEAINQNDIETLLNCQGFMFQANGLVIISDFQHINRPKDLTDFHFNLDFLNKKHLRSGIEINLSRGCSRGCIFCCKTQGKHLRQLPIPEFDRLLTLFSQKLEFQNKISPQARTININDDDIFQDLHYAGKVFSLIKKHHFKLWGVQTSIHSFFNQKQKLKADLLEIISDKSLFVEDTPLVWLGTDAFLKKRGKKLAKWIPDKNQIEILLKAFEIRDIKNHHYWISSDYQSSWDEFIEEFLFIIDLKTRFPNFGLLAHSPFLIPYSSTPLFKMLTKHSRYKSQIKYRSILESQHNAFTLNLTERVETRFNYLNKLLRNESDSSWSGFFDDLNQGKYLDALKTAYRFLRQERISLESVKINPESAGLIKLEAKIEEKLSIMLSRT